MRSIAARQPLEVLVGSASFEDLVTRVDLMRRIGKSDAEAVAEVKRGRDRLNKQRSQLATEKRDAKKAVMSLKTERDRLQAKLKSKQAEFAKVKAELDAVRGGPNRPSGLASVAGPNGMVFPVVGSYYYSDTWGASRGGGRRTHKGTDIMAPRGTPVVAILAGNGLVEVGGLGGKIIWLLRQRVDLLLRASRRMGRAVRTRQGRSDHRLRRVHRKRGRRSTAPAPSDSAARQPREPVSVPSPDGVAIRDCADTAVGGESP